MNAEPAVRKICLVGDFGVGKTSIVARFVNQVFSDKYQSTVGVSIKTKIVDVGDGARIKTVIWDIAGNDKLTSTSEKYLNGVDGIMLVVDGTRRSTLDSAFTLAAEVRALCGEVPSVCLMNKCDLSDEWVLGAEDESRLRDVSSACFTTSAKTGNEVEAAFVRLTVELLAR